VLGMITFGGRAQDGSSTRVFKYTNNCFTMINYREKCGSGKSVKKCESPS